ncbi:MAG TPA: enoyl-CoA hydratase [Candidatus Latescibacteria bacterium]|jgi:enoyl-CoA hydratase/carnithine racemase|nr:enoyl-CoA hydratase [Candidatus Latescibacterota bacterium]
MPEYEFLQFEINDHVAWITMDRPAVLNAIHPPMQAELDDAWKQVRDDDDIWVGVITGAGDRAFSAGSDLKWRASQTDEDIREHSRAGVQEAEAVGFQRGSDCWKPLVAMINGYAVGGGLEVALGCDLLIAAETAKLGLPEARRGLLADAGGIHRLTRRIPWHAALGMLLTGRLVDAAEAQTFGLLHEVVPATALRSATQRWVDEIRACGPLSLRAAKEAAVCGAGLPLAEAMVADFPQAKVLRASADFVEGPRAFADKHVPEWTGR